jgi:hypothetical protein
MLHLWLNMQWPRCLTTSDDSPFISTLQRSPKYYDLSVASQSSSRRSSAATEAAQSSGPARTSQSPWSQPAHPPPHACHQHACHAESASACVGPVLDAAAAEVAAKLEGYTAELCGTHHPGEVHNLVALMGDCARTIAALNDASNANA